MMASVASFVGDGTCCNDTPLPNVGARGTPQATLVLGEQKAPRWWAHPTSGAVQVPK
jgi:hypothetical protein